MPYLQVRPPAVKGTRALALAVKNGRNVLSNVRMDAVVNTCVMGPYDDTYDTNVDQKNDLNASFARKHFSETIK